MSTRLTGNTGLSSISALLIVFKLLLLMSSNATGQSVILLDSSQSIRAITDLELGDKCKEEKALLLEEIDVLEKTRDKLFEQVTLKDSMITMIYMNIDTAYQELSQLYLEKEAVYKSEIKKQKRKKRGWMFTTFAAVGYIAFQIIKP